MPSVKVTSTELLGEMSYTTTYEFSSFEDFQKWEGDKQQALVSNIFSLSLPDDADEDPLKDNIASIMNAAVKKKDKLH